MTDLLTCAISETNSTNKYKIIYYNFDTQKFEEKDIPREQFHNSRGEAIWDLFHVTQLADDGTASPKDSYSIEQVISFFNKQKIPARRFFKQQPDYAIVKIDAIQQVKQPYRQDKRIKSKLDIICGGTTFTNKLNKDFRWINYWDRSPEDKWADKCRVWEEYLNNDNYDVYAVMYTHQFRRNRYQWIAGLHCLNKDSLKGV